MLDARAVHDDRALEHRPLGDEILNSEDVATSLAYTGGESAENTGTFFRLTRRAMEY